MVGFGNMGVGVVLGGPPLAPSLIVSEELTFLA